MFSNKHCKVFCLIRHKKVAVLLRYIGFCSYQYVLCVKQQCSILKSNLVAIVYEQMELIITVLPPVTVMIY